MDAGAASSSTSCAAVRATIPSTQRARLWATSATLSRLPIPIRSAQLDRVAAQLGHPGLERDVRAQARRSNNIASERPSSGGRACRRSSANSALSSAARRNTCSSSPAARSAAEMKSRPRRLVVLTTPVYGAHGALRGEPHPPPTGAAQMARRGEGGREDGASAPKVRERTPGAANARRGRQLRRVSAWCTAGPFGRASGRTSCAPSSADRGSGGRPGAAAGGWSRRRPGAARGRSRGGSRRPGR